MVFQQPKRLPNYQQLRETLLAARDQIKNYPLYQTIIRMLDIGDQISNFFSAEISSLDSGKADSNLSYLTTENEFPALPNSRQHLPGTAISFDDSVDNQRTVSVSQDIRTLGYWSPLVTSLEPGDAEFVLTDDDDTIAVWTPLP